MAFMYLFPLGVVLALVYRFVIRPAFLTPLSKVPAAHFTAHFSPAWLLYIRYFEKENRAILEAHRAKGPILRIAPNELSVNSLEGLKKIYSGNFPKTDFYPNIFQSFGLRTMFTSQDKQAHAAKRRALSHIYSKTSVLSSPTLRGSLRKVMTDHLIPKISSSDTSRTPLEMVSLNAGIAMDAFTNFQFGQELGTNFIDDDKERDWYIDNTQSPRKWMFWVGRVPNFTRTLARFGYKIIPDDALDVFHDLEKWELDLCDRAEKYVTENPSPTDENKPVIFMQQRAANLKAAAAAAPSDAHQPYPYRFETTAEMFDHTAASHETSGITLTYLQYELSLRPALQADLCREMQGVTDPKDLDSLPLLDAVVHETLRLWSPAPGAQPRVVPSTITLEGYAVPAGTVVQSYAYTLHRNEDVFPNAEQWNPSRWLDASPKQLAEMRHWFWAFSSGGAMCLGQHVASTMIKAGVAALYTNFTSTLVGNPDMTQLDNFIGRVKADELYIQWSKK
ncbi:hypothetical protein AAFC00_001558 [Neodothiora populina]|uniref:Cytochrome P450 n=1 Tax=Neodothiora populina TaxID=2781224 RepID=A0ABR3PPA9_9PEZI